MRSRSNNRRRLAWRCGSVTVLAAGLILVPAATASAHPLGNFSRNVYAGLTIAPQKITIDHVLDLAEIPTFQERNVIDVNGDGTLSDTESAAYKATACRAAGAQLHLSTERGRVQALTLQSSSLSFPPGAADLPTQRLECTFVALTNSITGLNFRDDVDAGRVGWHEITAVGDGVRLQSPDVPTTSPSNRLTSYPPELTASPLAINTAALSWVIDPSVVLPSAAEVDAPTGPGAARALTGAVPGGVDAATQAFTGLIADHSQSVGFVLLAFVLAIFLGALHALAPGHGKTLMAGYLLGAGGRAKDALLLGATVTVTHTTGVLILGVALATTTAFAPESAYPWLGLAAGILSVGAGLSLMWSLRKGHGHTHTHTRTHPRGPTPHTHTHGNFPDEGAPECARGSSDSPRPVSSPRELVVTAHVALMDPPEPHQHDAAVDHHHHDAAADHDHAEHRAPTHRRLVVLGLAGGLVPSPSAVVVLLAGIALGKPILAVALVIAYGVGMAGVLAGAGILVLRARGLVERRLGEGGISGPLAILARAMPMTAAFIVVVAGAILVTRSIGLL